MAKREAVLRLYNALLACRVDLRKRLADELASLCDYKAADSTCDSADAAFETSSDEMSSQLAGWDARDLNQVERALVRLKQRSYGICEGGSASCQRMIPAARLNALPYTTFCINCEREMEKHPAWQERQGAAHWNRVLDAEASMDDPRVDLAELEMSFARR